jgi:murein DD-endopeptidase MepM/ murein hydrolase activator NlpD
MSSGLSFWALPQDEVKPYVTYDLQKAKQLLTAAGYPNGFDLEIISSNNPSYQNFAEIVVAELKKLGINPPAAGQPSGVGGPFEKIGNPTFKALFNSWKKLDQLQDDVIAIPSDKPVHASVEFTSGYGVRSDPFKSGAAFHPGIDLAGSYGSPIFATADGTVIRAGWNSGGYGNLVELDHGRGITTRYGHMSAILVKAGDHVKRGEQIGRMGSTGRSTGNHLHYEVRIDGRAVNPIPFMKSTDYVLAMQRRSGAASMDQIAIGGPNGGK